jgi:hypothetical protein
VKINRKVLVPAVIAVITGIVLAAALASPREDPTGEPEAMASFVEEWNALAGESFADLDLTIPIEGLQLVAEGDTATTYEFRFWHGATTGEYHKISVSLAKEGNPHKRAGTMTVSVESNRSLDTERLLVSWGLLIAALLPDGTLEDATDVLRELEVVGPDVDLQNHWKEITRGGLLFGFEGFQSFFLMYGYQP